MPKKDNSPFTTIDPSGLSKNILAEEQYKRKARAAKTSKAQRRANNSGKMVIDLDTHLRDFVRNYTDATKSTTSEAIRYLLSPIAKAYNKINKKRFGSFALTVEFVSRRDDYGDFDKDYNLRFLGLREKISARPSSRLSRKEQAESYDNWYDVTFGKRAFRKRRRAKQDKAESAE